MPPDIRTGLPAVAGSAPSVGMAGQGPPGSDPLAALFASLLAQSGGTPSQTVPALPKLRAGAKTDAQFTGKSAPAKQTITKQTTVKTTTETIANTTLTSAPLPTLPPLPIQRNLSQMRPITPPIAAVTVGQKTMDTLPAAAVLPQETTSTKPDGELPLQEARSQTSGASTKFPVFLIALPSLTGTPPAPALPLVSVTALPRVIGSVAPPAPKSPVMSAPLVASASLQSLDEAVTSHSIAPAVVPTLSGMNTNSSALVQPLMPSPGQPLTVSLAVSLPIAAGQPRTFALNAGVAGQPEIPSVLVSALPAALTKNRAVENSAVPLSTLASAPVTYMPSSQGLPIPAEALSGASQVPGVVKTAAATLPDVTLAVPDVKAAPTVDAKTIAAQTAAPEYQRVLSAIPSATAVLPPTLPAVAGLMAVSKEAPQILSVDAKPELSAARPASASARSRSIAPSAQKVQGGLTAPQTFVQDVGTAREGDIARDGKPATEGVTVMDGPREGRIATEGMTTDGRSARDGTTMEGAQATEGTFSTVGAVTNAPDQTHSPSAGTAVPATPVELPQKGLKSAAVSADNNTGIASAGAQAMPAKMLPPELTLQLVGKRSARNAASETDNTAAAIPAAPIPATGQTVKADAKPLTQADRAELVRQVADGVGAMPLPAKPETAGQMTLQLHPHDWGQLQVSVKIAPGVQANAVQTVTAHIVAQTPQVKAALESNSGELRSALRSSGLHLDRITVTVQSTAAGAQAGTASGGSHHGTSGAFSQTASDQKTDFTGNAGPGTPSFSAFTGSHGGRQGSQAPPAYTTSYPTAEPDGEEGAAVDMPRRLMLGQVDTRA